MEKKVNRALQFRTTLDLSGYLLSMSPVTQKWGLCVSRLSPNYACLSFTEQIEGGPFFLCLSLRSHSSFVLVTCSSLVLFLWIYCIYVVREKRGESPSWVSFLLAFLFSLPLKHASWMSCNHGPGALIPLSFIFIVILSLAILDNAILCLYQYFALLPRSEAVSKQFSLPTFICSASLVGLKCIASKFFQP